MSDVYEPVIQMVDSYCHQYGLVWYCIELKQYIIDIIILFVYVNTIYITQSVKGECPTITTHIIYKVHNY